MRKIIYCTILFLIVLSKNAFAQWTAKANFTNGRSQAANFSIGTKGYAGLGVSSFGPITHHLDWWEYDPATNAWTQKANFAGSARVEAASFSIGAKGYVCLGYNYSTTVFFNDLWEYDATANTWTAKSNFTGTARRGCASFVVGTNGYVGTGSNASGYQSDFYKYSQSTNTWSSVAVYPLICSYSGSFSDGTSGYLIGGALPSSNTTNAVYQYNPTANAWTAKANYPGVGRYGFSCFYAAGNGYATCGTINGVSNTTETYLYNAATNVWYPSTAFNGSGRWRGVGFAINNKGYVGMGSFNSATLNDFREFTPCTGTATITSSGGTVICGSITLNANTGAGLTYQWIKDYANISGATSASYGATAAGSYACIVTSGGCAKSSNFISLTSNNPVCGVSYVGSWYLCSGTNALLPASITSGGGTSPTYQWTLNGANISGATASTYTATQSGAYSVKVTNTQNGCTGTSTNTINLTYFTGVPNSTISYIGNSSSCDYVVMQLTGGSVGGYTYQWQLNNLNIAGANSYYYTANTSGNYKCVVTNPCGSSSTNALAAALLGSGNIFVTGNTTFCSGVNTLTAPFFVGAVYQWYNSGNPIGGANNYSYNATGAGVYSCQIITVACGSKYTNTVTLDGAPTIINTTPLTYCTGGVALQANGGNTVTAYQWKLNGVNLSGSQATTSFLTTIPGGTYTCEVTSTTCGTVTSNALIATAGALTSLSLLAPIGPSGYTDVCSPPGSLDMLAIPANTGYSYDLFNVLSTTSIWNTSSNIIPTPGTGYYHIEMTTLCGTAVSNTVSIRNITYPNKVYVNGPTTFCSSFPSGLEIIPDNGWPYSPGLMGPNWDTYQWRVNGVNIPAPNGTAPSYGPQQTGWYSCVFSNSCGSSLSSDSVFVTVNQAPVPVTTPSGNVSICAGGSVVLTANTGANILYQWKKNNINIAGATSSSYTVTTAGNYTVLETNNLTGCFAYSSTVVVTVGAGATATVTPSGTVSFCAGSSVTLNANTGTGIAYQWYKSGVAQAGATSASYLIGNAGTYYVVENSSCGTATSNSVVVTQINNANPTMTYTTPTIFCTPGTITFTANTFAGVTYQWQKNSINIAGATAQAYTATTNGKYRVKETANGCTKQGQDVQVTTATSVTAVIAANGPTTFCTGGSVVLSVTNAIPGYSYQWKNNNVNIAGATTSSYTATTAGTYTCYVSASCGNSISNSIVVSTGGIVALVNPSGTVNICTGATAALSANTGTGFTFQWKKNGTNIAGATTASYYATTAGAYTVAITSPCGNATSSATTVAIAALTAAASPASTTICNGSAATFTANTGYNYTYQWKRAGVAIAGATASTHANSTAGNYTVVITQGGVCSATSNIAALTVISNPNPTVTLSGPTTFCAGQSVTITANTFAGVTYQWIKGSTNIAGATSQAYTATTAGQYNVKETANGCTKQMGVPVVVTVNCREEGLSEEGRWLGEIKVIPNPFSNEFLVSGFEFTVGDRIELVDVIGRLVMKVVVSTSTTNLKLQTSNLLSGIYFLKVTTATEKKTIKVVKQ